MIGSLLVQVAVIRCGKYLKTRNHRILHDNRHFHVISDIPPKKTVRCSRSKTCNTLKLLRLYSRSTINSTANCGSAVGIISEACNYCWRNFIVHLAASLHGSTRNYHVCAFDCANFLFGLVDWADFVRESHRTSIRLHSKSCHG